MNPVFDLSLSSSLPLAERPYLLQPEADKERLFGVQQKPVTWQEHEVCSFRKASVRTCLIS